MANQGAFCFPSWPISAFRFFGLDPVAGYLNRELHGWPSWCSGAPGSRPASSGPASACPGVGSVSLVLSWPLLVSLGLLVSFGPSRSLSVSRFFLFCLGLSSGSLVVSWSVAVLLGLALSVPVPCFNGPPLLRYFFSSHVRR